MLGLSDDVQILLACGIHSYNRITNGIFRLSMSAFEMVTRNTLLEHKLLAEFCVQALSCFH